ncbi:hypothetical protein IG389_07840 [Idiomarina abyssalis]|jgi:hypothetical protein|uniref:Uncharacterized protein n=1 Tax=Idiomarina abyssalis TaxID=86102 RepID=A0A8I1G5L2_9GAMM|nr:hypothetical protein [Idiomarina abyssalis]MBJ7265644.1 hypothetical protein [Idiomarina abyssalis]MBJ7273828.1 hypothetical protein [Idiomarina abyssalis]MBJ7314466.1 hypothetical protein [Idiomarina abyssalis]
MALTSMLILWVTALGYTHFHSSKFGQLKFRKLSASSLTANVVAFGALHIVIGLFLTWLVSSIFGFAINVLGFAPDLLSLPEWLLNLNALGSPLTISPLIVLATGFSFFSAFKHKWFSPRLRRLENMTPAERAKELVDNELDRLLLEALDGEDYDIQNESNFLPLRVVLDTRKVYIGNVVKSDVIHQTTKNVVIVPLFSGYQDEQTLELVLTDMYRDHYNKLFKYEIERLLKNGLETLKQNDLVEHLSKKMKTELTKYAVTLPASSIKSASFFSVSDYEEFLKARKQKLEKYGSPTSK